MGRTLSLEEYELARREIEEDPTSTDQEKNEALEALLVLLEFD